MSSIPTPYPLHPGYQQCLPGNPSMTHSGSMTTQTAQQHNVPSYPVSAPDVCHPGLYHGVHGIPQSTAPQFCQQSGPQNRSGSVHHPPQQPQHVPPHFHQPGYYHSNMAQHGPIPSQYPSGLEMSGHPNAFQNHPHPAPPGPLQEVPGNSKIAQRNPVLVRSAQQQNVPGFHQPGPPYPHMAQNNPSVFFQQPIPRNYNPQFAYSTIPHGTPLVPHLDHSILQKYFQMGYEKAKKEEHRTLVHRKDATTQTGEQVKQYFHHKDKLEKLKASFSKSQYILGKEKEALMISTGLTKKQIRDWFANKRCAARKEKKYSVKN